MGLNFKSASQKIAYAETLFLFYYGPPVMCCAMHCVFCILYVDDLGGRDLYKSASLKIGHAETPNLFCFGHVIMQEITTDIGCVKYYLEWFHFGEDSNSPPTDGVCEGELQ